MKKQSVKNSTRSLTEGAVIAAIYALIAIIVRYLITGTDSMIYYFLPIPLAVYSLRNNIKYSCITFFVSIALSFLFANQFYVLTLFIPNFIIGLLIGIMINNCPNKLFNYLTIFIVAFLADLISIFAYEKITGIGYFDDVVEFVTKIFKGYDDSFYGFTKRIVTICSVIVLVVDSIIKEFMIIAIIKVLSLRIKINADVFNSNNLLPKYNPIISIIYIIFFLLLGIITPYIYAEANLLLEILLGLVVLVITVLSFYFIYQVAFFMRLTLSKKENNTLINIIIVVCAVILFPISIIIALVLNFSSWNVFKTL